MHKLTGQTILVTGAARRIGKEIAIALARTGANVILHYGHSNEQAEEVQKEITGLGRTAFLLQADLGNRRQTTNLISRAREFGPIYGLVNNAAVFEPVKMEQTSPEAWDRHIEINLTAPFLLCQAFSRQIPPSGEGRIVNILDWRALRPSADHFPYTISKAALAAMTQALAVALAPRITVNGLALGAILPPSDSGQNSDILSSVPAGRWARLNELTEALVFLISGSGYTTGEIIHIDGGRHLV